MRILPRSGLCRHSSGRSEGQRRLGAGVGQRELPGRRSARATVRAGAYPELGRDLALGPASPVQG